MKKLLLLLIIPLLSLGQERINKSNIKFISKSKKLSKAIGWNYSEELGKWRSCKNCIPEYRGTHINYYDKKKPNFKSIQFAQVESSDNYILIIKETVGGYQYPSIGRAGGYITNTNTEIYKMSSEEFLKLVTVVNEQEGVNTIIHMDFDSSAENTYNEKAILREINKLLEKEWGGSNARWYINSQIIEGKSIIRFLPPNIVRTTSQYPKNLDFETNYFEISKEEFMKILQLKK